MALANDGGATITLELIDENAVRVQKKFVVPEANWSAATGLIADLKTIRDGLVTALSAITSSLVLKSFINISQTDDAAVLGPSGSNNADTASIVVNLETAPKKATYQLPSPVIGVFVGSTGKNRNVVDINDADLLTFLEFFTTTDGDVTISDGETIADTGLVESGRRVPRSIKAPTP